MVASQQAASPAGSRIAVLPAELADQIAAGEVVERPASVVKELVENAIDAGATRVEVELEQAGLHRIVVRDDGVGIHPDDLPLCITRHATSKVRAAADLVELATLGFRGEALASIAAVAYVTLDSRTADAAAGQRLRARPGLPPELEPVGMAKGTRIEVQRLFKNVPARRKFMRAEATEVGHCSDMMLRLAVANPGVHLRLRHDGRELLDLPATDLPARVAQILARKSSASFARLEGEREGVGVLAFLAPAAFALRNRSGLFVVVRRRVVKDRNVAQAVSDAYGDAVPRGRHPLGAVLLDPPRATVDVNVHPQKAEVRFSDAQRVYAAVRRVLADFDPAGGDRAAPGTGGVRRLSGATTRALDQWRAVRPTPEAAASSRVAETPPARYKLRTAAAHDDYAEHRGALRRRALALQTELPRRAAATVPVSAPKAASEQGPALPAVTLLTCLPGPVAIVQLHDDLLAVHLPTLRSHLVYRRLVADLGAGGDAAAQGLLSPVVVKRPPEDVELLGRSGDALVGLGVVLDPFGEDAVMVRAVPAGLRHCALEPDVVDLVDRIMPWLRVHEGGDDPTSALHALAQTRAASDAADPAPRLARRWIRELLAEGADLDDVPGITRWTAPDLVR